MKYFTIQTLETGLIVTPTLGATEQEAVDLLNTAPYSVHDATELASLVSEREAKIRATVLTSDAVVARLEALHTTMFGA
jgi:hypothetical protein